MHHEFRQLSADDLAMDCIADLFSKNESEEFVQLRIYFEGFDVGSLSEEALLSHLRRLVFSKVNQRIFQIYNEIDPSLGKILRNIKLSIQSLQNFTVHERFGEHYLLPGLSESLEHLPPIDEENLVAILRKTSHSDENIPKLLAGLFRYLRDQTEFSRLTPVVMLAKAIRTVYAEPIQDLQQISADDSQSLVRDTEAIIATVCEQVKNESHRQYVIKKNLEPEMFGLYFDVIKLSLERRLLDKDGQDFSYFDMLSHYAPNVTKEEYAKCHKSRLEYLARLTYDRAINELRKNMQ